MTGFGPDFLSATTTSFAELLAAHRPEALPGAATTAAATASATQRPAGALDSTPAHGTTIVAVETADGVVMAGDRRATAGSHIASHTIEKVHLADAHSLIGIAGTAGIALDLVRLLQVEFEHYEKIEGAPLSLEGRANRLAALLRSQLGLALSGLAVVPLFAGVEAGTSRGRIFSFDITGGRYDEVRFHAIGSGAGYARGALKKLWEPDLSADRGIRCALEALYDAADDDSATGGPDLVRGILPTVCTVDSDGARTVPAAEVRAAAEQMIADRLSREERP